MKRLPRRLKFVLLAVGGVVGLGLIAVAITNAQARAQLEAELARLSAAGEPVSLAELKPKPVAPETNAATYLARAKNDSLAINKEVFAAEEAAKEAGLPEDETGQAPSPPVLAAMRKALDAYPNAVSLLVQASECTDYDAQLDYTTDTKTFVANMLPEFQDIRAAFRVLNYQVLVSLADGKQDDAMQSCLVMFRLARLSDRGPMMINYLVSLALRGVAVRATNHVLRFGPLPPAAYDALEVELVRQDLVAAYRHAMRTERAFGMQAFEEIMGSIAVVGAVWPGFKRDQSDALALFTLLIETADRPYSDPNARAQTSALVDRAGTLTKTFVQAVQAVQNAHARLLAQLRALRVLVAILRLETAGKTVEPSLDSLGLPADVKIDPYNGEPLRLKKTPEGWTIYSVGVDYKDDGGTKLGGVAGEDAGIGPVPMAPPADKAKTQE
jgi:hypothetical protein